MSGNPFPEVRSKNDLDDVSTARYVECVGCIDPVPLKEDDDPVEWAQEHVNVRPWHARFRITTTTNFSVTATPPGYPDVPYPDAP